MVGTVVDLTTIDISAKRFSFLNQNLDAKLIQLIRNYITVGELELARSALQQLCFINQNKALEILNEYIYQQNNQNDPRPREIKLQLLWFCTNEYCSILKQQQQQKNIVSNNNIIIMSENNLIFEQRKIIEFEIFLHETYSNYFGKTENTSFLEILRYFQNLTYNPQLLTILSSKACTELESILTFMPQNGHIVFQSLCNSKLQNFGFSEQKYKEINSIFQQNKLKLYNLYIKIMDSLVDKRQFTQMLTYTQYLDIIHLNDDHESSTNNHHNADHHLHDNNNNNIATEYLKSLFLRIISTCSSEGKSSTISLKIQIYESLLSCGNYNALRLFCELEDYTKVKHVQPLEMLMNPFNITHKILSLPRPFDLYKRKAIDEKQLLDEYFHYIRITKNHIFEFTLEQCFEFIKCKQIDDLKLFFTLFPKLKALVLLLLPTYLQNNFSFILELFETFAPSIIDDYKKQLFSDSSLYNQFNYYFYLLQINMWMCSQFPSLQFHRIHQLLNDDDDHNHYDDSDNDNDNDRHVSILDLIYDQPLHNMYNQILMYLIDDRDDSPQTREFKRYNRSAVIIHSILSSVLSLLHLPSIPTKNQPSSSLPSFDFNAIQKMIHYLDDEHLKLSICEVLYDFIFIKQKKTTSNNEDNHDDQNHSDHLNSSRTTNLTCHGEYVASMEAIESILLVIRTILNSLYSHSSSSPSPSKEEVNDSNHSKIFIEKKERFEKKLIEAEFRFEVLKRYPTSNISSNHNIEKNDSNEVNEHSSFVSQLFGSSQSIILRCIDNSDFERCNEAKRLFSVDNEFYETLVAAEQLNTLIDISTNRHLPHIDHKHDPQSEIRDNDNDNDNDDKKNNELLIKKKEDERIQSQILSFFQNNISNLSEALILCFEVIFASNLDPHYYRIFLSIIPNLLRKIMEEKSNQSSEHQLNTQIFNVFKDLFVKCKLLDEFFDSPIRSCWDSLLIFINISASSDQNTSDHDQYIVNNQKLQDIVRSRYTSSKVLELLFASKTNLHQKKQFQSFRSLKSMFRDKKIISKFDYLYHFLDYLLQVGSLVFTDGDDNNNAQKGGDDDDEDKEKISLKATIELINQSPDQIVSNLLFSNISIARVERISSLFNRDVIHSIINSIIVKRNKSIQDTQSSSSSSSSDVKKESLELFYKKSPILSIFISILLQPVNHFSVLYNQYALLTSKNLCEPLSQKILFNYIKYRNQYYQLFTKYYLKKEYFNIMIDDKIAVENIEYRKVLVNLSDEHPKVESFIQQLANLLINNDDLETAVQLLDQYTVVGASDSLLERLVLKIASFNEQNAFEKIFQIIQRFDDINVAKNAVFTYFNNWNINDCLSLLSFLSSKRLSPSLVLKEEELGSILKIKKEMELYKEIIDSYSNVGGDNDDDDHKREKVNTSNINIINPNDLMWQSIAAQCRSSPSDYIRSLIHSKKFEIAKKLISYFEVDDLLSFELHFQEICFLFYHSNYEDRNVDQYLRKPSSSSSSSSSSLSSSSPDVDFNVIRGGNEENKEENYNYAIREKLFTLIYHSSDQVQNNSLRADGLHLIERIIDHLLNDPSLLASSLDLLSFLIQFLTRTLLTYQSSNDLKLFTIERLLEIDLNIMIVNIVSNPNSSSSIPNQHYHPHTKNNNNAINETFIMFLKNSTSIILENLIMNQRSHDIERIISIISNQKTTDLLLFYIEKAALQLPYIKPSNITHSSSSSTSSSSSNLQSSTTPSLISSSNYNQEIEMYIKGEDLMKDNMIRNSFTFKSPSITMIQSYISFASEKRKVFEKLILILNQLALLSSQIDIDLFHLTNLLIQLSSITKNFLLSNHLYERSSSDQHVGSQRVISSVDDNNNNDGDDGDDYHLNFKIPNNDELQNERKLFNDRFNDEICDILNEEFSADYVDDSSIQNDNNENEDCNIADRNYIRYRRLFIQKKQKINDEKLKTNLLYERIEKLSKKYKFYLQLLSITCIPRLSIADLDDLSIVTMVRDKLIENEYIRLSIELSRFFQLPSHPPLLHLAITLLSNGYFNQSKELFAKLLIERSEIENNQQYHELSNSSNEQYFSSTQLLSPLELSSPNELSEYQDQIVSLILNTIDSHLPSHISQTLKEKLQRFENNQLTDRNPFQPSTSTNNINNAENFDMRRIIDQTMKFATPIYTQSLFFLSHFASPKLLVQFFLKNNQLEEAIIQIINNKLQKGLFVEVCLTLFKKDNGYSKLKSIISNFDPNFALSKEYLLALCRFLAERKIYEYLYDMQLFLKDYCRAALSCISQYKKSADFIIKMKHLETAKGYFITAIDSGLCKTPDSKLKESEINAKLREINLQAEILKYYYNLDKTLPKILLTLSIFGINEEKLKIAEYILYTGNYDLAFKILKEFNIEVVNFYKNAAAKHAKAGRFEAVNEIIMSIKKYISDDVRDIIIVSVIRLIVENGDKKSAEKLIPKISSLEEKVNALIVCSNFKAAFNLATQENRVDIVMVIKEMAISQMSENPSLSKLVLQCDNFIEKKVKN